MNNADIVIGVLDKKGFSLTTDGSHIFCTGPRGELTPDLMELILHYKQEIIKHLQHQQVALMSLKDFSKGNYAVKVFSKILGKEVFFCSNIVMRDSVRDAGLTAYLPDELKQIVRSKPDKETMQAIDNVKSVFPEGTIIQQ